MTEATRTNYEKQTQNTLQAAARCPVLGKRPTFNSSALSRHTGEYSVRRKAVYFGFFQYFPELRYFPTRIPNVFSWKILKNNTEKQYRNFGNNTEEKITEKWSRP